MKCSYCGKKVKGWAKYCPFCGRPMRNHNFVWIIIGMALVFIIGVFIHFGTANRKNTEGDPEKYSIASTGESVTDDSVAETAEEKETIHTYSNGDYVYCPSEEAIAFDEDNYEIFYDNLLIAFLDTELSQNEKEKLADLVQGKLVGNISNGMNVIEILVDSTKYDELDKKAQILMETEHVDYAAAEIPIMLEETAQTDPWETEDEPHDDKNNDGDEENPDGNDWWAEAIGAYTAWEYVDNNKEALSNVKVGVIDTGVDAEHEDFMKDGKSKVYFLEADDGQNPADHGTHVAGIIAANNNDKGTRGIADTELVCCNFEKVDKTGNNVLTSGEYIEITKQLIIEKKACVINNSWGMYIQDKNDFIKELSDEGSEEYKDKTDSISNTIWCWKKVRELIKRKWLSNTRKVDEAYEEYRQWVALYVKSTGMQIICMMTELLSSGNEQFLIVEGAGNGYNNGGPGYLAEETAYYCAVTNDNYKELNRNNWLSEKNISYDTIKNHIVIVGAVSRGSNNYTLMSLSNYGSNIDLVAPGEAIYSTVTKKDDSRTTGQDKARDGKIYALESGTSMAAPMVSGSAALLWSIDPTLSAKEVKNLLISTAGEASATLSEDTRKTYPMLNIGAAVTELTKKSAIRVDLELKYDLTEVNGEKTEGDYGIITGLDDEGNVVWEKRTDIMPCTEVDSVIELGSKNGRYYYSTLGEVHAIQIADGAEIWTCEVDGMITEAVLGKYNMLYGCGYYEPNFCAIDGNGVLVKEIQGFSEDYMWPTIVSADDTEMNIYMDWGDVMVSVDLSDYSYEIKFVVDLSE